MVHYLEFILFRAEAALPIATVTSSSPNFNRLKLLFRPIFGNGRIPLLNDDI